MINLYCTWHDTHEHTPAFQLTELLLKMEAVPYQWTFDPEMVATLTEGKANPSRAFVGVTDDGVRLLNAYDLMHWIEGRGLRRR